MSLARPMRLRVRRLSPQGLSALDVGVEQLGLGLGEGDEHEQTGDSDRVHETTEAPTGAARAGPPPSPAPSSCSWGPASRGGRGRRASTSGDVEQVVALGESQGVSGRLHHQAVLLIHDDLPAQALGPVILVVNIEALLSQVGPPGLFDLLEEAPLPLRGHHA
eukprot:CAMPEP_0179373470 /NCGR_PEP_ID=MMETSP0797-20121207/86814_1 /TAXON_ID=47934 /ORGANISM="Dinophysis acuminata, Strain DAEP01" /LENGTH=162 /DNA_ID=CAMNT_0021089467 /DNA_START=127 /DNA_END=613 /DNA_ORIENTATION=-